MTVTRLKLCICCGEELHGAPRPLPRTADEWFASLDAPKTLPVRVRLCPTCFQRSSNAGAVLIRCAEHGGAWDPREVTS